ncbi:hypothetical protein AB0I22_27675 [Streptomyces sp. NPDC050610]|uniref:hypothetical protein n=1 Tax=Streptomyces sp. NPDC050610 TaxID=3157097 RepID=UPI0034451CF3
MVEASAAAQAFAQDVIAPQQQVMVEAEAVAREPASRLEQNAEHLRELAELTELREQLPQLEKDKETAGAAYTAARQDTDLMVKQATDRWSDHLLRRMRDCDPEVTTASVSPDDFSVTVNGGAFDSRVVAGHGRARTNISVLLALRDTAREVPAMPVPQFLIVDGPFTGLGSSPKDQRTGGALLNGLTDLATSEHPAGSGGQVIIACTELRGSPGPAVREIRTAWRTARSRACHRANPTRHDTATPATCPAESAWALAPASPSSFALRRPRTWPSKAAGTAWGLSGLAFLLFGGLNYFTRIGLIVNTM